jgi:preprotein translocase subunit SecG
MITSLMIFQAIVSVLLIITVLLQFGKGAEAGIFSGGASESVLSGAQKGNILVKITIFLSILFLGNSVLLAKLQSNASTRSILDSEAPVARPLNNDAVENAAPVAPAAPEATSTPTAE